MNMNRICVFAVVCVALLAGCGKKTSKASDEIDFGTVENSTYRNEYFGLSMKLPPQWSVQDQEGRQKVADLGGEMLAGDDENLKSQLRASEPQTIHLLVVSRYPLGAPVVSNPNIICVAERVRHLPGIKRGKDYHFHTKKGLQSGQVDLSFPEDIYAEQIGGRDFDVMSVQMAFPGQTVKQKHYAAVMKGYALVFAITFANDEEEAELMKVLDSVTFE